jgi:3-deoxy-D-manno-octulosonic-acid transferase
MTAFSKLIYLFAMQCYGMAVRMAAFFKPKAQQWVDGRKPNQYPFPSAEKRIWFHTASLGEYEQARPVIDELRRIYSDKKIVITFFSPSGYETVKKKNADDEVLYLPLDTPANARFICNYINPEIAVFVKYEFWYFTITELKKRNVPVLLIAALFKPNQIFFRWYGGLFRNLLHSYEHLFVQDMKSVDLLVSVGVMNATATGDTRFDRVLKIASENNSLPLIEAFQNGAKIFIAGSTWEKDEKLFVSIINEVYQHFSDFKFIIAPHEINAEHIEKLQRQIIPVNCRYSSLSVEDAPHYRVLIIDNIGMLSRLYRYADMAYVGGGFNQGIHNILEAAACGIPVVFGPKYGRFKEAQDMLELKTAFCIRDKTDLENFFRKTAKNEMLRHHCQKELEIYFEENAGATQQIVQYVQQKLTGFLQPSSRGERD